MRIIKLDAIDSTNTFLKGISSNGTLEDYTVVMTKEQTNGRGQMGTVWNSEASKNLTFSVYKMYVNLQLEQQFYISMVVALALVKTLKIFGVNKLQIKWPNDILSENKKICGVLIENVIKQTQLSSSILGVGLNVNQINFETLPKASSLKLLTGKVFDLDEILNQFLKDLEVYFNLLEKHAYETLKGEYEKMLFRKNKPSTFKNAEGHLFSGFIKGVSKSGNLVIELEDEIIKEYALKEVTLLY
jgi:BirA family biotin operon repressor/biotin-[acetyl-CoA-carboxylase] ligase